MMVLAADKTEGVMTKNDLLRVALLIIGLSLLILVSACDALTVTPVPLTATWEYSAPTLAASPVVPIRPPTERPPDYIGPGQSNPTAAALPWESDLPPMVIDSASGLKTAQIALRDNTVLYGVLYENPPGLVEGRLPGVLLIGSQGEGWGVFPEQLRDAGLTVLVVDMGNRRSSIDFVDVIQAFSELGTVHPGLMAVIGADAGADQALIGCAVDFLCDTAILLSPIGRDTLVNIMASYNPRPLLIAASRDDPIAYPSAQSLQIAATGEIVGHFPESAGHGVELLKNPELVQTIIQWMQRFLVE
jgi:hypothetical protein